MKNQNQIDNEMLSRTIDDEGAIRPRIDTGYRVGANPTKFLKDEKVFDASERTSAVISNCVIDKLPQPVVIQAGADEPQDELVECENAETGARTWVPKSELEIADADPTLEESDGLCAA